MNVTAFSSSSYVSVLTELAEEHKEITDIEN